MNPENLPPPKKAPRWRKLREENFPRAETFLRERERFCVSASARFLRAKEKRGNVWYLSGPDGEISALLFYYRGSLFPVLNKKPRVPEPRILNDFFNRFYIHAVQGPREDVAPLERHMENNDYVLSDKIDYDLMELDAPPRIEALRAGPASLTLRPPLPEDEEEIFALQSVYEKEEVLPANAVFDSVSSRMNLRRILSRERVLLAELDGKIAGKINTSAKSFSRYQIGGVFVRPDCRGMGIGAKMTAVFVQNLLAEGCGVTLFVKKHNSPARAAYRKVGFTVLTDYRIIYYSGQ
jgi:ribosomal protein S18 acetylase RimI-like enzyme